MKGSCWPLEPDPCHRPPPPRPQPYPQVDSPNRSGQTLYEQVVVTNHSWESEV